MEGTESAKQKFEIGDLRIAGSVTRRLPLKEVFDAIERHSVGDWGDLSADEWETNERYLREQLRLFSAYNASDGTRFWIITKRDPSSTTVLLQSDFYM